MSKRSKRRRSFHKPTPPPDPKNVTQWGKCQRCGAPGLAFIEQFNDERAICGYCGGSLLKTTEDLTKQVAHVEDEPLYRWRERRRGPSLDEQWAAAVARDE